MSKIIYAGEKTRIDLTSKNISKLMFVAHAKAASGLSSSTSLIDWEKINVTGILKQANREYNIFNGNLFTLLKESAIFSNDWAQISTPLTLVSGVSAIQYGFIDFGGILNLDNDDKLSVDIRTNDDIWAASATGDSYLEFSEIEDIGLQYVLPKINVLAVKAAETVFAETLGDNVTSIVFINDDKTGVLTADKIIDSVQIKSDRYNANKNYTDLLVERIDKYPSLTAANARAQSFSLVKDELDKCSIELNLVSGSVTSGNNYVVYRNFEAPAQTVAKASVKAQRHKKVAENKVVS